MKKLEEEIEALEKEAEEINRRLSENSGDYMRAMEDSERLSEVESLQLELMERWEEAGKELAEMEKG